MPIKLCCASWISVLFQRSQSEQLKSVKIFLDFFVKLQQWHCSKWQNLLSFGFYSFSVLCAFCDFTKKMSSKMRRTPLFGFDGNLGIPIIPSKSKQPSTSNSTSSNSSSNSQQKSSSSGKQKSNTKFGSYSVPHTDYSNSKVGFWKWNDYSDTLLFVISNTHLQDTQALYAQWFQKCIMGLLQIHWQFSWCWAKVGLIDDCLSDDYLTTNWGMNFRKARC